MTVELKQQNKFEEFRNSEHAAFKTYFAYKSDAEQIKEINVIRSKSKLYDTLLLPVYLQ